MKRLVFALLCFVIALSVACGGGGGATQTGGEEWTTPPQTWATPSVTPGTSHEATPTPSATPTTTASSTPTPQPTPSPTPTEPPSWLFMYYAAMDNNLDKFMLNSINTLEFALTHNSNTTMVMEVDTQKQNVFGSTTTKRLRIMPDSTPLSSDHLSSASLTSDLILDLGETDTSSAVSLRNFISWAMATYPSDHYCLFLQDHGGQWMGYGSDETSNPEHLMSPDDIAGAINEALTARNAPHIDLLVFDACLMGGLEPLNAVKDCCLAAVASETVSYVSVYGSMSNPTISVMQELKSQPYLSPIAVANVLATSYIGYMSSLSVSVVTSVFDMSKMASCAEAVDEMAQTLSSKCAQSGALAHEVMVARRNAAQFNEAPRMSNYMQLCDLSQFVSGLGTSADADILSKANSVLESIEQTVVATRRSGKFASAASLVGGLSIAFPDSASWDAYPERTKYLACSLCKSTSWNEFLDDYSAFGSESPTLTCSSDLIQYVNMPWVNSVEVLFDVDTNEAEGFDDIDYVDIQRMGTADANGWCYVFGGTYFSITDGSWSYSVTPEWNRIGDGTNTYWLSMFPVGVGQWVTPIWYYEWRPLGSDYIRNSDGTKRMYWLGLIETQGMIVATGVYELDFTASVPCSMYDEIDILYPFYNINTETWDFIGDNRLEMGFDGEVGVFSIYTAGFNLNSGEGHFVTLQAYDYNGNSSNVASSGIYVVGGSSKAVDLGILLPTREKEGAGDSFLPIQAVFRHFRPKSLK